MTNHDVNVNLTIKRAPKVRQKRKHPVLDVLAIIFAAMLIGAATGSSVVFGVVAGVAILLYLSGARKDRRRTRDGEDLERQSWELTAQWRNQSHVIRTQPT